MNYIKSIAQILSILLLSIATSCNIEPFEGEVPEESNNPSPASSCEEAIQNTAEAGTEFTSISSSDANYSKLCNAYKKTLEDQVAVCGDEGGVLQTIIDSIGDCEGDDGSIGGGTEIRAFMTANINGEQYNDMKPNSYLFFPGGVSVNDFFTRVDDDYLVMQGNSGYTNPTTINLTDREINLKIPSVNWKEGTYPLYDDNNDIFEGVCYYTFFGLNYIDDKDTRDLTGEIIISKFNLVEKVIEGTFEFEYMLINEVDNSEEGPFRVTGTFDYSLDDEFFD